VLHIAKGHGISPVHNDGETSEGLVELGLESKCECSSIVDSSSRVSRSVISSVSGSPERNRLLVFQLSSQKIVRYI